MYVRPLFRAADRVLNSVAFFFFWGGGGGGRVRSPASLIDLHGWRGAEKIQLSLSLSL